MLRHTISSEKLLREKGHEIRKSIIVIIIIIIISSSFATSPVLLLYNDGDAHRSVFKFQTAALPVFGVMFQLQLSCVVNLLNISLTWLPSFSLSLLLLLR